MLRTRLTSGLLRAVILGSIIGGAFLAPATLRAAEPSQDQPVDVTATRYRSLEIQGTQVWYREAGRSDAPVVLLLHGFPTSSHMYRNLIQALAGHYRVIAPDYPGFGHSGAPPRSDFKYTFANYAAMVEALTERIGVRRYALYLMDYGAPVGFRLAVKHPDRVSALIVQNGNAYVEGLQKFWEPIQKYWRSGTGADREALRWLTSLEATRWQYTHGVPDVSLVSPDTWTLDQALLDRPGNQEIQLDLFYDYRTNIPLYPEWQAYFRKHQPAALVMWGKNDQIFVVDGAAPYKRDLPNAELHLLDAGHFALESQGPKMAQLIRDFLHRHIAVSAKREAR